MNPVSAISAFTLICQLCAAQEITVAAAADLQSAMQEYHYGPERYVRCPPFTWTLCSR